MPYLNPQCATCMVANGCTDEQFCNIKHPSGARLCQGPDPSNERELIEVQDLQKMPRDNRGILRMYRSYTKTDYF